MKVRVEFYSRLKEIVGMPGQEIVLGDGATIHDLMRQLYTAHPRLRDFERSVLFGIGVDFVQKDRALHDSDVIAIMPPVQGG